MSLTKSTIRRAALLTSSSLAVAGIAAVASLGAALAPTAALAQAVCDQTQVDVADPAADTVGCPAGTYTNGITYESTGDLTVTTGGAVVLTADGATLTNLVGPAESLTWDSTAGLVTGNAGTAGPVIDVRSAAGPVTVRTGAVTGTAASVTHAINAESVGGGAVTVSTVGAVSATNSTSGNTAIRAIGGGAVTVTTSNPAGPASGAALVSGRLFGIYAQAGGSGALTIDAHTQVSTTRATAADAAIEARTGAGLLTVNVQGALGVNSSANPTQFVATINGGNGGAGIRSVAGGDAEINIGVFSNVIGAWGLDATIGAGATTTVNIANYHSSDSRNWFTTADGNLTRVRASGAGALAINVNGALWGAANLSALTGGADISIANEGVWWTQGAAITFGPGADRLATEAGDGSEQFVGGIVSTGTLNTTFYGGNGYFADPVHVIDFGDGDDIFENGGYLMVSGSGTSVGGQDPRPFFEGETRFENLETFVNSGVILLGVRDDGSTSGNNSGTPSQNRGYHLDDVTPHPEFGGPTDGYHDDILSMPGTTFVGEGGEIFFDVDLNGTQSNCERSPTTGELAAADCIIIAGGATEGVSYVRFEEPTPGDRGRYNPDGIVIVEVTGGTSAQGHFAVSPNVRGYSPQAGGIVDKGYYAYLIGYKPDTQQHVLVSVPGPNAYQLPLLAQGGQNLWRLSTGSWFERQADIRGEQDGYGGAWLRVSGETADRDVLQDVVAAGATFTFDNTYKQTSYAVTGGADLLFGASGDTAFVAGVMLGYANSKFEYEDSRNFQRFDSWTLGGYGSVVMGGLYVDLAVNANNAVLDNDVPSANLFPAGTILSTRVMTVGAQLEAGWRVPVIAEGMFVEPLVGVSYVRSKWEDLYLPADDPAREGITAEFDDPTSTRAGVGGRVGIDRDLGFMRAQASLLGRVWEETGDETRVTLFGPGVDPTVANDFSGRFNELSVGASLYSPGGMVSGFLNIGGRFADDYEARTASAGVRLAF